MASNLSLNARLSLMKASPSLIGNWTVTEGKSWETFNKGGVDAVRKIRLFGRTFWVTATYIHVDRFANLVAYGLLGALSADKKYLYFNLHRVNPEGPYIRGASTNIGSMKLGGVRKAAKQLLTTQKS